MNLSDQPEQSDEIKGGGETGSYLRDFINCHYSKCFEICSFNSLAAQQTRIKSWQAQFKELPCKKMVLLFILLRIMT